MVNLAEAHYTTDDVKSSISQDQYLMPKQEPKKKKRVPKRDVYTDNLSERSDNELITCLRERMKHQKDENKRLD